MKEKEWKEKRNRALRTLRLISTDLSSVGNSEVLLKAEEEYCRDLHTQVESLLIYWDERSVISRQRFVVGDTSGG